MDAIKKGKSLLTLPRTDLNQSNDKSSEFLLLELPKHWSVSNLKDSYFVAKPKEQASFLTDKESFDLHHVETSNVWIIVPPSSSNKKRKLEEPLSIQPVRLLKKGGSGASFLELRKRKISKQDIKDALKGNEYNPYQGNSMTPEGKSLEELSNELRYSKQQTIDLLRSIEAFVLPSTQKYVLLSEEALQEAYLAIIATLVELDECHDYATTGVDSEVVVKESLARMAEQDRFEHVEEVLRHSILNLRSSETPESTKILLDVEKIARCVARRLLQKKSSWTMDSFLSQWQSEVPGVGEAYTVSSKMLRGMAVEACDGTVKYLPSESLSMDPKERFAALFEACEKWEEDTISAYVEDVSARTGVSVPDLLLQYAKAIQEEGESNDVTKQYYIGR